MARRLSMGARLRGHDVLVLDHDVYSIATC